MKRFDQSAPEDSFNFRIDPALKAAFEAATAAQDMQAPQVLHDFMRQYVARQRELAFHAEAKRQSLAVAARTADPDSDEAAVMAELDAHLSELAAEWK